MAFLNYTSTVKVENTIGRIQKELIKLGCDEITSLFDQGKPVGLSFLVSQPQAGRLKFRLPVNPAGVLAAMKRDREVPHRYENMPQAERTAWRIVEDWVKSQVAIIQSGQTTTAEVFLAHAVNRDNRTLYQELVDGKLQMLRA